MKNLVALLCVISALVVSVSSYKCYSGFSRNSTTCDESETECLGNRCMTVCQYSDYNGRMFKSIMKGCANETMCGANGSATVEHIKYRFHVNCCTGDLCNSDGYKLPSEDPTPNGVKCPTAYCMGSLQECKSEKEMNCTGSMDQCFEFRSDVIDPGQKEIKISVKGCMNADSCKFNFDCAIGISEVKKKFVMCYKPQNATSMNEYN
ncbi:phospholipase A2 inhibitor and Ly6/PLAUR domain-containing protein-like [Ranitomeya variabilis]|uniref:phospholipase A2 inhibitor and Ly6/PLAUR domain-containing protein-like n=1 Tax=Ranitomeya variabilis TaxID=490064 RepID=UPI004055A17E